MTKVPQTTQEFRNKQLTLYPRKKRLIDNATPSELAFKKILDELGIYYKFQKGFIAGDFYCIVDFYLPAPHKICIEIDGKYHDTPEQKKKDWAKDNYLHSRKLSVIRIKNEDVENFDLSNLII